LFTNPFRFREAVNFFNSAIKMVRGGFVMTSIVNVLLDSFELEAKQARCVLNVIKDKDLKYTPSKDLRPLVDLANHLAQVPLIDPSIYDSTLGDAEQARAREHELNRSTMADILVVFDEGVIAVKRRFTGMEEKDFFAKTLKPFYETGSERSWANFLPDIITHIAMHKMQVWMYLKLAGAPVNMMTYYGHHPE
ncbi:MAG: DinB family protein, partial [Candidatus Hermodarchaeia archaeon]